MALTWNKKLAVGHSLIDQQHQELFRRFGAFVAACQIAQGKDQVDAMFQFLGSYIDTHFREEERLMKLYGYPDAPAHCDEHRSFVAQLEILKEDLRHSGPSSSMVIQLNQTLLAWLIRHIQQVDVQLGHYLQSNTGAAG